MKVEIKDKDKQINTGLRAAGFKIEEQSTELILNIIDYIRKNESNTTLRDIVEITDLVKELYKDNQL